jgi:drug/metabolite transporter (DMT)-like permease
MSSGQTKTPNVVFELALLACLAFLWGSSYLLTKLALDTIAPVTVVAIRVSVAAVFLVLVMQAQNAHFPTDTRIWRSLLIQAIFNSIAAWTLVAWGQQYIDSALAGVLNSTSPIFVFLITVSITRHEAASAWQLLGAVLGVLGVALIVGPDTLRGLGQQLAAQVAVLLGALLYACAAIYGKRFTALPATVTAAGTMIWASAFLIPAALVLEQPWNLAPSVTSLLAVSVLGVFCTGAALLLYFRLVRTLGSMGVASQSYLRAGISVLLGVFFLGEQITVMIGFGLLAIIVGVAVINLGRS